VSSTRVTLSSLLLLVSPSAFAEDEIVGEPCTDALVVQGFRHCTPYGAWGHRDLEPDTFIEFGLLVRHLQAPPPQPVTFRKTDSEAKSEPLSEAIVFTERLGFGLSRHAYLAADIEIGSFAIDSSQVVVGGLGAFGLGGRLAPLSFGIEVGAGYRGISNRDGTDLHGQGVLEARARGGLWVTPWFTLTAIAGASQLNRGEWMGGLVIGLHSRSFGNDQ
jgi:hypothetical protein